MLYFCNGKQRRLTFKTVVIVFHKDGLPRTANGEIIILITGEPKDLQPLPVISDPIDLNKIKSYRVYHPSSSATIIPITAILDAKKTIDSKVKTALEHYPKNIENIKDKAKALLNELNQTEIKKQEPFSAKIKKITEALALLDKIVNEKSAIDKQITEKQKIADKLFDEAINDQQIQLGNFKECLNDKPHIFDAAYTSIIGMYGYRNENNPITELWRNKVEKPNLELIALKNNKLIILNLINNINNDIAIETKNLTEEKNKEDTAVKDAVKFTADFYKEVSEIYGEKGEQLAKALAEQSKGKKIRNVDDALKAYAKHQANINKKINAKDREAIAKTVESVKVDNIAKNFQRFSKSMKYTSVTIDCVDWVIELKKAIRTDNWRPFFVKTETIVAGIAATALAGFAFSVVLGGPLVY